jgi:kynurenine formamidase
MMSETWTDERMRAAFEAVKNWGRWGEDDERGTLNLITPAKVCEAAASVVAGETVSCSLPLAVMPSAENPFPAMHMMVRAGDDCVSPSSGMEATGDFIGVSFHGMATSHIDALCHVFVDGLMYNGFSKDEVKSTGARRGAITAARDGIVTRGVVLDIPRTLGVPWLEPGEAISIADLEAAEAAQHVQVREGDALMVATGRDARRREHGPWSPRDVGLPGLHVECVEWLHERGVSILGSDAVHDPMPHTYAEGWALPVHQACLVGMGLHLLDNLRLDRLTDACARHDQWHFQFTVAPLHVEGGTGSPVNAIAVL